MNRYESAYVILLTPSRYEHIYIIWLIGKHAKTNTRSLNQNIHTRKNQRDKPLHEPNQAEQTQITIYITPCTNHNKCTSNCKTKKNEFYFERFREPILTSVQMNEAQKSARTERILYCSRPNLIKCTDESTWTEYLSWTRILNPSNVCTESLKCTFRKMEKGVKDPPAKLMQNASLMISYRRKHN